MESQNQEHDSASRLLHAQTHIWNHVFSFTNSMSLKSCRFEHSRHHSQTWQTHASFPPHLFPSNPSFQISQYPSLIATPHPFWLLLSPKVSRQIEGCYVLTDASTLLLKDNPLSVTPFLLVLLDPILTKPWYQVAYWFQNDDPTPFDTAHGKAFWEYAGVEPKLNQFFNDAMASDARLVSSVVIDKFKDVFKGLESLVDVGGGTGTMAKVVAKAFSEIQCTVFDLPHVVDGLQDSGNLKFVGGDMFKRIPSCYAILLKWIIHDWNDEECVKILKKSKEAVARKGKEGKVIIIDMIMGDGKGDMDYESTQTQLFFDTLIMVFVTGKERTEKEWAKLIFSAGFSDYKITPVLGLRSLIQAFP